MRIGFTGDVMIGRLVNEYLDSADDIWGNMLPIMQSTDLNLINLEAALTHHTQEVPKVFNFKADPEKVRVLKQARVDVVNLANNHVLDYGEVGLLETLDTLKEAHIKYVGAGRNIGEAKAPLIINKIGIIGCTDNEPTWEAGKQKPGIFYVEVGDIDAISDEIKRLKKQVDIVILTMHWGPNMRTHPTADFIDFAHDLIDCGVDILHGHSAHIFQGIEIYKKKVILYDTGDFVDDYYVDPFLRNDRSFFFIVDVDSTGIQSVQLIPTLISRFQVNRSTGNEAQETITRMSELSKLFNTIIAEKEGSAIIYL